MSNWKKLSGENNWEGLLKPFDKSLCETLVHYCKRVEVVYDTLQHSITDPSNYGKPKYEEQELFSKVGLEHYTINNYVYGDSKLDLIAKGLRTWVGFVAVASDEGTKHLGRRDILISWRGTVTMAEWVKDIEFAQTSAEPILGKLCGHARVHSGFLSIYMSARDKVLEAVQKLVKEYQHEEISITVTGHSLGSAFAILTAADIVANGYNTCSDPSSMATAMVTVFAFSSPKVGNSDFVNVFNSFSNLHLLHIKHHLDIVPRLPPTGNYSTMGTVLNITYTIFQMKDFLRPVMFSASEILVRFHILKTLHMTIERQQVNKYRLAMLLPLQQFTLFYLKLLLRQFCQRCPQYFWLLQLEPILEKYLPEQVTVLPMAHILLMAVLAFIMMWSMNYKMW